MSELSDLRSKVDKLTDKVGEINERGARMDANIVWIRDTMGDQVKRTDKIEESHGKRMDKIEDRQRGIEWRVWFMAGAGAIIGSLLGFGGANKIKL